MATAIRGSAEPVWDASASYEIQDLPLEEHGRPTLNSPKTHVGVFLIIGIVTLYSVSGMLTMATNIDVMYDLVCLPLGLEQQDCLTSASASDKVAGFTSATAITRGLIGIVANTLLGMLSDSIGRKPVIVGAITVSGVSQFMWWFIASSGALSSYWWLMLPVIIDGFGGGPLIVNMTAISYISDTVIDAPTRGRLFALLEGLNSSSLAIGPMLGSLFINIISKRALYVVSFTVTFLCGIALWLFVDEARLNPQGHESLTEKIQPKRIASSLFFNHIVSRRERKNTRIMLFCALLGTDLALTFVFVVFLYPKRLFGWTAVQSGYYMSLTASWRTLCLIAGFPMIYNYFSKVWIVSNSSIDRIDAAMVRIGLVMCISGYLVMGMSQKSVQFYLGGVLDATSAIGAPVFRGALLKHVPAEQSGSFQASMNIVMSAIGLLLPPLFLQLMSWSFDWMPSLAFVVLAFVFLGLLSLTFLIVPEIP